MFIYDLVIPNKYSVISFLKDEDKDGKKKKRKRGKCIDTIIDGSMMGAVLAVCLAMVLGASFFAYKNLYYAVMKKWYPDTYKN